MNRFILPVCLGLSLAIGCQTKDTNNMTDTGNLDSAQQTVETVGDPKLLYTLPDKYNTPDGMALAPDGTVYLSVPNLADNSYPGILVKCPTLICPSKRLNSKTSAGAGVIFRHPLTLQTISWIIRASAPVCASAL
ncbi:hypothetical protein [Spirosoma taeanense]|uniref:hypothetical protein n=1 Tax=Spirosoma taeanense TaxID=2735870 RepID=UPI001F03DC11|nr:hypothetical protein [Spirosoma taeanense]